AARVPRPGPERRPFLDHALRRRPFGRSHDDEEEQHQHEGAQVPPPDREDPHAPDGAHADDRPPLAYSTVIDDRSISGCRGCGLSDSSLSTMAAATTMSRNHFRLAGTMIHGAHSVEHFDSA